jgi:hypothetical protein
MLSSKQNLLIEVERVVVKLHTQVIQFSSQVGLP